MKLLIRNLPRSLSEKDLQALFESYGLVQSCTIVTEKDSDKSKGFGFIEMPKTGQAKSAMKNLNGKDIDGNKIRVKKSEQRNDNGTESKK